MKASRYSGFSSALLVVVLALFLSGTLHAADPILALPGMSDPLSFQVASPQGQDLAPGARLSLVEAGYPDNRPVAQVAPLMAPDGLPAEGKTAIVATVAPGARVEKDRRFKLTEADPAAKSTELKLTEVNDKSLQIADGDRPVLVYNFGTITNEQVPKSDHRRSRSCYIHPVYGLNGEVLTDDFPRDHYHHHGIFWTWPHVQVDGTEHDLWAGSTIRQQFVNWLARESGPAAAILGVENGWFVGDKKVMIERVWLHVYHAADDAQTIDIDLTLIPTDKPVTLWGAPGKSYGGLTMRFHPPGPRDPANVVTTPGGVTPVDLSTTILRWADYTSKLSGSETPSGAAIFISPNHPDFPPEWLLRHYGPLCVGWPGIFPTTLQPGKPVQMSYRIWIHKDSPGVSIIGRAYSAYLAGLKAEWIQ